MEAILDAILANAPVVVAALIGFLAEEIKGLVKKTKTKLDDKVLKVIADGIKKFLSKSDK